MGIRCHSRKGSLVPHQANIPANNAPTKRDNQKASPSSVSPPKR